MFEQTMEASGAMLLRQLYELDVDRVSTEISPEDGMFENNPEHYFSVGQSALRCIKLAMLAAGKDDFRSILDFGCGYGRVLRVLRAAFPEAELTACDISKNAVDFCASTFDAEPVYSSEDIGDLRISKQFDLIWCGTLLTNVDEFQFSVLLRLFDSLLRDQGVLVCTTHGPFVTHRLRTGACDYGMDAAVVPQLLKQHDATGFGYADYPQEVRARLGVKRYGISLSSPSWVCREIERLGRLRLLTYTERAWDNHQDSVACIKRGW
jgi:SAM-dependent methyltransferase